MTELYLLPKVAPPTPAQIATRLRSLAALVEDREPAKAAELRAHAARITEDAMAVAARSHR